MKTITIIGGRGQMGQLFATYWQNSGATVLLLDRDDWDNARKLLHDCDMALICVPIHNTLDIIKQTIPYLSDTTILADFTSIKSTPINSMLKLHAGPVLGLHPMFGPTIASPANQVIINCGGRGNYQWVIDSLLAIGFTVTEMTPKEHDQSMSFIQGIEHFTTFVLGSFLRQHNQYPNDLFNLASPIYQAKLALMGRIFDQDAALYADIITADSERINLIEEYAKYFQHWITKLQQNQTAEFIAEFDITSQWMGEFTHKAQLASDQFLTAVTASFPKNIL